MAKNADETNLTSKWDFNKTAPPTTLKDFHGSVNLTQGGTLSVAGLPSGAEYVKFMSSLSATYYTSTTNWLSSKFSLEFFIRFDSSATDSYIVARNKTVSGKQWGWYLYANAAGSSSGHISLVSWNSGTSLTNLSFSKTGLFYYDTWYHVVFEYDGSDTNNCHLYIDGVEVTDANKTYNGGTPDATKSLNTYFSRSERNGYSNTSWMLARYYNNVILTSTQVSQNYNAEKWRRDDSQKVAKIRYEFDADSTSIDNKMETGSGSGYNDGTIETTGYHTHNSNSGAPLFSGLILSESIYTEKGSRIDNLHGPLTFEWIIKSTSLSVYQYLWHKLPNESGYEFCIYIDTDGRLQFYRGGGALVNSYYTTNPVISTNTVYHIQIKWNLSDFTSDPVVYINNVSKAVSTSAESVTSWPADHTNNAFVDNIDTTYASGIIGEYYLFQLWLGNLTTGASSEFEASYNAEKWRYAGANVFAKVATVTTVAPSNITVEAGAGGAYVNAKVATLTTSAGKPTITTGVGFTAKVATVETSAGKPTVTAGTGVAFDAKVATLTTSAGKPSITTGVGFDAKVATIETSAGKPTIATGVRFDAKVATLTTSAGKPTVSIGADVTAKVATVTTSTGTPTVSIGADVTAKVATVETSAGKPTIATGVGFDAKTATVETSAGKPTVTAGTGVAFDAKVATVTTSAGKPTITTGVSVDAKVATVTMAAPPNVTIDTGGSAEVFAKVATIETSAGKPTISIGADVTAKVATIETAAGKPTIATGVGFTAKVATVETSAGKPTISIGADVTAKTATVTTLAGKPTISIGADVTAKVAAVTTSAGKPTVTTGTGVSFTAKVATVETAAGKPTISTGVGFTAKVATVTMVAPPNVAVDVGGGVEVFAKVATSTMATGVPVVSTGITFTAKVATIETSAGKPTVTIGADVNAKVATVETAAHAPTVITGAAFNAKVATIETAAHAPIVTTGISFNAKVATIETAACVPTITAGVGVIAKVATMVMEAPPNVIVITEVFGVEVFATVALMTMSAPAPYVNVGKSRVGWHVPPHYEELVQIKPTKLIKWPRYNLQGEMIE